MADSSTNNSLRKSSQIAKRLKTEPSITVSTDINTGSGNTNAVAAKKEQKQTTATTRTEGNVTKHPPSLTPASLRSTSINESISSPLECDFILKEIFSYVGDFQYFFIGSVNSTFEKTYVSLYPKKTTHFNASTIEHAKYCWDIICKINDDENKDKEKRKLWHSAARYGKIEVIKYLLELLPPVQKNVLFKNVSWEKRQKNDWKYDLCSTAAKYGQLELLQWACDENICVARDDGRVCEYAIGNGNLDAFHWAQKNGFCFDSGDAENAGVEASKHGKLDALKWLQDNDKLIIPHPPRGLAARKGLTARNSCSCIYSFYAAACGHIEILKWVYELYGRGRWDGSIINGAISGGHLSIVQYLLDKCSWNIRENCNVAAYFGHLDVLQLLCSLDWDDDDYHYHYDESSVIAHAAAGGHLEIIEWAIEKGWPLTESACTYAAGFEELDILMWLRANGCPWDSDTTKYASTDEIYEWAKENGCPVGDGNPREDLTDTYDFLWLMVSFKGNYLLF